MKLSHKIALTYLRTRLNVTALVSPKKAAEKALAIFCTPRRSVYPNPSTILKKAALLSFKMDNLNIRGYRWNHPSVKKILIAHGFESSARNFDGYILPLIKKGYEIVAFDAPAHGNSDGKEITLPVYIQTLKHIESEYGPFNAYLAHSFGGLAVAHLLETIPHDENTKVVLIAPATETTSAIEGFFHFLQLNGRIKSAFNTLIKLKGVSPEQLSIRRAIKNVKATTLWLHDDQDNVTPYKDAEKVKADNHPNIEFVISSGLGHSKIYRNKDTITRIIQFL